MTANTSQDDARDAHKIITLGAWRRQLSRDRAAARQEAVTALQRLQDGPFSASDLSRFMARMMAGVTVPSDYGRGKTGAFHVA